MGAIVEFPNVHLLKDDLSTMQNQLCDLIFLRDELKYTISEAIKTNYMMEVGGFQCKAYELYCRYHDLCRQKNRIQTQIDEGACHILCRLGDKECLKALSRGKALEEKLKTMNEAIETSRLEPLSKEENLKAKGIYKELIKKLSPDLNPNLCDLHHCLFHKATEAYKRGNLCALETIAGLVKAAGVEEARSSSLMDLRKEKKRVKMRIKALIQEIDRIRNTTPYTWRHILENDVAKKEVIERLKQQITIYANAMEDEKRAIVTLVTNRGVN